jgi:glycosyltransferase involved in cell wall biosynthesis
MSPITNNEKNSHTEAMQAGYSDALDISVVFATRDRESQLNQTLDAYRGLNTEGLSWELIVVDNNSSDGTSRALASAQKDLPLTPLFVEQPGQNCARNEALTHVRGRLVVFTDDDALPHQDCLKSYLAAADRWPNEAIFGARIEPRFPPGTPAWIRSPDFHFASTAFARYQPAEHECLVSRHPYGPSFAVRREALCEHLFPTHLGPRQGSYAMGGEGHFLRRLADEGWGYVYVPSAYVEHVIRPEQVEPRWLVKRAHNKGRGQAHLPSRKRPRRVFWRGVSLRLWLATARAGFRYYALAPLVKPHVRANFGIQYELRRGELQERLSQRSRGKATNRGSVPDDGARPSSDVKYRSSETSRF